MFNVGPAELMVILIIALVIFGPRRLPEVGRTVGKSLKEFRKASQEIREGLNLDLDYEPPVVESPAAAAAGAKTPAAAGSVAPDGLELNGQRAPAEAEGQAQGGSSPAGPVGEQHEASGG